MDRKNKALIAAAAAVGGAAVVSGAAALFTDRNMKKEFSRGEYPVRRFSNGYRFDPDYSDTHTRINVQFKSGENTLQGYIYGMENTDPKGLIVFAHGITVGHETYIGTIMHFADKGWRVFAYDATGSCTSEGDGTVGLVQSALDLDCALDYAETDERLSGLPIYLVGHSWGGYAVCAVLNFGHEIKAAASLSGYAYPAEMLKYGSEDVVGKIGVKLFSPLITGYNKHTFGDLSNLNAVDGLNSSDTPALIIHGDKDDFVDFRRVSIYSKQEQITNPHVKFVSLTGEYADHSGIFYSDRANEYKREYAKELNELSAKFARNGSNQAKGTSTQQKAGAINFSANVIPGDIREEFVKKWDKALINERNEELYQIIDGFFDEVMNKK